MARRVTINRKVEVEEMGLIRELKQFNEQVTTDVEELVLLEVQAQQLQTALQSRHVPVPEFLSDAIRRVGRAIDTATADRRELLIKQLQAERAGLMTASEKRAQIDAQLAALTGATT